MSLLNVFLHFFIAMFWLISSPVTAQEVRLATGVNTDPPFVYGDYAISSEYPGITIDILKLIASKTGIKFTIDKRPWARVVKEVKSNELDGGFHFSFKEARKSFVAYPIEQGKTLPDSDYSISNRSYVLYRLKDNSIRWNGETLVHASNRPVNVAAVRGGSIISSLKEQGHNVVEVGRDGQMLKLLLLGRVDGLVGLENMIDAKIESLEADRQALIEKATPAVVNKPYYVAFSKKFYQDNPQTAWKIWEMIKQIKGSGELSEIVRRYTDR